MRTMTFRLAAAMTFLAAVSLVHTGQILHAQGTQNTVTVAGNDVNFRLGITIQPRVTYVIAENPGEFERLGFGLRRFRLRTHVGIGDRFLLFSQLEGSGVNAQLLDMRAEYLINDHLRLRMGRFVGAQPRGMAVTLHSETDVIDRPAIADIWARSTWGADARSYGLELFYRKPTIEYRVFVHNGDNRNNFRLGPVDADLGAGRVNNGKLAVSTLIRYFPEKNTSKDFGAYLEYNASRNPNTISPLVPLAGRAYWAGATHAYWGTFPGKQAFRLKFDAIAVQFEEVSLGGFSRPAQLFGGATLFGGYLVNKSGEVVARIESYLEDATERNTRFDLYSLGYTHSFSAAAGENFLARKVTAAWTLRSHTPTGQVDHIFMIQLQIML